jgi:hypothetical protein
VLNDITLYWLTNIATSSVRLYWEKLPATIPPEVGAALASGMPAPAGLSEKERAAFRCTCRFQQ